MNGYIRTKWLEALRSGRFKQATGMLRLRDHRRHTKGHCCLGVLAEVCVENGVCGRKEAGIYGRGQALPPFRLAETLGMPGVDPVVRHEDGYTSTLSQMNDSWGLDFRDIADLIESCIPSDGAETAPVMDPEV